MVKRAEPPRIWVEWEDSASDRGWIDLPRKPQPLVCRSIGFLIDEGPEHITVASSIAYTNESELGRASSANNPMTIPKRAIVKRKRLAP